mgnify:FL=1
MNNEYVIITGCTSGIGLSTTKLFYNKGYSLLLLSKEQQKLDTLALDLKNKDDKILTYAIDLTKENEIINFIIYLKTNNIKVIGLINNAGRGNFSEFLNTENEINNEIIELNIKALVLLCHEIIPLMGKGGTIVNIASTGGFAPGPYTAVYYASKSFVLSFSEALHEELKDKGINVCVLSPGTTNTPFFEKAQVEEEKIKKLKMTNPDFVASSILKVYEKKIPFYVVGLKNRLAVFSLRFLSHKLTRKIMTKIGKNRVN